MLGIILTPEPQGSDRDNTTVEQQMAEFVSKVLELRRLPHENLPAAIEDLLQHVKNVGFSAPDGAGNVMRWQQRDQDLYEVFGYVELGDQVVVERDPIILDGVVRHKGLLRKVRERA
jgi:hypothetical protein